MITIDGSQGEGGGQILRTSMALACLSGTPVTFENIRAGRPNPGLQKQHLAAVRAAASAGCAQLEGDSLGSGRLVFRPSGKVPLRRPLSVGSAGSTTLVLQTVLPVLLAADGPSEFTIEGGTHNPWAPPFDFLDGAFLPLLRRMGADVEVTLERAGFAPRGGGLLSVKVAPAPLRPLHLPAGEAVTTVTATVLIAALPLSVAEREVRVLRSRLGDRLSRAEITTLPDATGPANQVTVRVVRPSVTEVVTELGGKGIPAEVVARRAAEAADTLIKGPMTVGEYLSDQLLLPMALAGGGSFVGVEPSSHTTTNAAIIARFLPVETVFDPHPDGGTKVTVRRK